MSKREVRRGYYSVTAAIRIGSEGIFSQEPSMKYDSAGNRSTVTTFNDTGPCVSMIRYTPQGKPCLEIDALGHQTMTHYDFDHLYQGRNVLKATKVDSLGNQDVFLVDCGQTFQTKYSDK